MAWTTYQILIVILLIISGMANTIFTKWSDVIQSPGKNGQIHNFNHPFIQVFRLCLGQICCLVAFIFIYSYHKYYSKRSPEELHVLAGGLITFNPLAFILPSICDILSVTLMYVGLTLTSASSYQMLRGSSSIFTGLLTPFFFSRLLPTHRWVGIGILTIGLSIVGVSDYLIGTDTTSLWGVKGQITGDLLIIMAQIFVALQMVLEEQFVTKKAIAPLLTVGYEGLCSLILLSIMLIPMYFINVGKGIFDNPEHRLEDPIDAWIQLRSNWQLAVAFCAPIFTIALYNYSGVTVSKELTSTTRSVMDSVRTVAIWIFGLMVGWEIFNFIELAGFIILMIGIFVYNKILTFSCFLSKKIVLRDKLNPVSVKNLNYQEIQVTFN